MEELNTTATGADTDTEQTTNGEAIYGYTVTGQPKKSNAGRKPKQTTKTSREMITSERNYPVVLSNDFIQKRRYGKAGGFDTIGMSLTVRESRILWYVISKLDNYMETLEPVELDVNNFCLACGIKVERTYDFYKDIRAALKSISDKSTWLHDDEGDVLVRFFQKVRIDSRNAGKIYITIDPDMAPYLVNLKSQYTRITLSELIRCKSQYSPILLQLLKSYAYRQESVEFSTEELRYKLDCVDTYKSFGNFRTRVIEAALKDINTYSSLKVEPEYKKTGKFITSIIFYIRDLATSADLSDQMELKRRRLDMDAEFAEIDDINYANNMLTSSSAAEPKTAGANPAAPKATAAKPSSAKSTAAKASSAKTASTKTTATKTAAVK